MCSVRADRLAHPFQRRYPIGAEAAPEGAHFRLWAPFRKRVDVVIEGIKGEIFDKPRLYQLSPEGNGYFSRLVPEARAGSLYRFMCDKSGEVYSDPVSRFQPDGPHGPSKVIDPDSFQWTDGGWKGISLKGQVIYEMHIGTFTREGTWEAATRELKALSEIGITLIEIMPVSDFAGRFGWGYDGVNFFAPTRLYGLPDDFRRFVDAAHAHGLGVILDVVYNHTGPEGCFFENYSADYFSDKYTTEWGRAINFDGPGSGAVREFYITNARYWIREFHLDGLRFDATQNIYDSSPVHILSEITKAARAEAEAHGRSIVFVAENEPQDVRALKLPEEGGHGMDALWSDDFHHSALVAFTGHNEAYYSGHKGTPQEFVSAAKRGFLYQGQWYDWQKKKRGTPAFGTDLSRFVFYTENHDQIANSVSGLRTHALASPAVYRAMTAFLLLCPSTPMLFQGQEFASSSPFLYFADLKAELMRLTRAGRYEFLRQFPSLASPETAEVLSEPNDPETFRRSKLDHSEREAHAWAYALHRDLLKLRREDPVFSLQTRNIDGAVLGDSAFVLRFFGNGEDRLLLVNLGMDLPLEPNPEPLLSPHAAGDWQVLWSSEDVKYGGSGTPGINQQGNWMIKGRAAIALWPGAAR